MTHDERLALILAPVVLWRNTVATFGCRVIHPVKRWAGVQVGLQYYTGRTRMPRKSVYYDGDLDAYRNDYD